MCDSLLYHPTACDYLIYSEHHNSVFIRWLVDESSRHCVWLLTSAQPNKRRNMHSSITYVWTTRCQSSKITGLLTRRLPEAMRLLESWETAGSSSHVGREYRASVRMAGRYERSTGQSDRSNRPCQLQVMDPPTSKALLHIQSRLRRFC